MKAISELKLQLRQEAGNKCANPGCSAWAVHFHHIQEWAIYQTHDAAHMIALCPSCHDAVHRGEIRISDDRLYLWKGIVRKTDLKYAQLWVDPAPEPKMWIGPFPIISKHAVSAITLSPNNRVSMSVWDTALLIVDMELSAADGTPLVQIHKNIVKFCEPDAVTCRVLPGLVDVSVPVNSPFVPKWLVNRIRHSRPDYPALQRLRLFRAEVFAPGIARVDGIWALHDRAFVADEGFHWVSRTHHAPITIFPEREGTAEFQIDEVDGAVVGFAGDEAIHCMKNMDPSHGPIPINPSED